MNQICNQYQFPLLLPLETSRILPLMTDIWIIRMVQRIFKNGIRIRVQLVIYMSNRGNGGTSAFSQFQDFYIGFDDLKFRWDFSFSDFRAVFGDLYFGWAFDDFNFRWVFGDFNFRAGFDCGCTSALFRFQHFLTYSP